MPIKIPEFKEKPRVNYSNPTGLPSTRVADPMGDLGRGLVVLGEKLDKVEKAKKKAKSIINKNDYENQYQARLLEIDDDIKRGIDRIGFNKDDKYTPAEYLTRKMEEFEKKTLGSFPADDSRALAVSGRALLNKQMLKTRQDGRKQLSADIIQGSNLIINKAIMAIKKPGADHNKIIMKLTEDHNNLMTSLGQEKTIRGKQLTDVKNKLVRNYAQGLAEQGKLSSSLKIVDNYSDIYTDADQKAADKKALGETAKAKINFNWKMNRQNKLLKDEKIDRDKQLLMYDYKKEYSDIAKELNPIEKARKNEVVRGRMASDLEAGKFDFKDIQSMESIFEKDIDADRSSYASTQLSLAYLRGDTPSMLIKELHKFIGTLSYKDAEKWTLRIEGMKNRIVEPKEITDALNLIDSRAFVNMPTWIDSQKEAKKAAEARLKADMREDYWKLKDKGLFNSPHEVAHMVIHNRLRNSAAFKSLNFIPTDIDQSNSTALIKQLAIIKRLEKLKDPKKITTRQARDRARQINLRIEANHAQAEFKTMKFTDEQISEANKILNSMVPPQQ